MPQGNVSFNLYKSWPHTKSRSYYEWYENAIKSRRWKEAELALDKYTVKMWAQHLQKEVSRKSLFTSMMEGESE